MKILVPVATDNPGELVFNWISNLSQHYNAEFHLLNVQHSLETFTYTYPSFPGFIYISDVPNPEHDNNALDTAENIAKAVAENACNNLNCSAKGIGKIGEPAEVILGLIETGAYDMVVLKDRDRSDAGRFFLGSITDKVVHHSSIPVLVLR